MHGNLLPIEAKQDQADTAATEPGPDLWVMMGLALGGVLTVVWIGFLLWAAFLFLDWAFGG